MWVRYVLFALILLGTPMPSAAGFKLKDMVKKLNQTAAKSIHAVAESDAARKEIDSSAKKIEQQISRVEDNIQSATAVNSEATELARIALGLTKELQTAQVNAAQQNLQFRLEQIQRDFQDTLAQEERSDLLEKASTLAQQKSDLERRERLWSASTIGLGATTLFGIFGCWLAWRGSGDQKTKVQLEIKKLEIEIQKLNPPSATPEAPTTRGVELPQQAPAPNQPAPATG